MKLILLELNRFNRNLNIYFIVFNHYVEIKSISEHGFPNVELYKVCRFLFLEILKKKQHHLQLSIWVKKMLFPFPIHLLSVIISESNKLVIIIEINIVSVNHHSIHFHFTRMINFISRKCSFGKSIYWLINNDTGERVSFFWVFFNEK